MRKTILLGLGLAVALAGTAAAQQGGQQAPRHKAEGAKQGRFDNRGGAPDGFLLRGITLSDAQRAQLQELRTTEHGKLQANHEGAKNHTDEMREAHQRGDTAAARAIAQRNRQGMAQRNRQPTAQEREQHIAAVRSILTAEQRVQFDKNVAEMKQHQQDRTRQGAPHDNRGARSGR